MRYKKKLNKQLLPLIKKDEEEIKELEKDGFLNSSSQVFIAIYIRKNY